MSISESKLRQLAYGIVAGLISIVVAEVSDIFYFSAKSRIIAMFIIAISGLMLFYWPYIRKIWMRVFLAGVVGLSSIFVAFTPSDKIQMNSFAFYPIGLCLYAILALALEIIGRHFEQKAL